MLSVPGKEDAVSVYSLMRRQYPEADSPLTVHRLDMGTSGLDAHCQEQARTPGTFKPNSRTAWSGNVMSHCSKVSSPKRTKRSGRPPALPDPPDRPRQIVGRSNTGSPPSPIIKFWNVWTESGPVSLSIRAPGKTHQLRIHAAHPLGLHCPIIGDELREKSRTALSACRVFGIYPILSREKP